MSHTLPQCACDPKRVCHKKKLEMCPKCGGEPIHRPKGLAALSEHDMHVVAALGGRSAHRSGNAHEFSSEEARSAARKRYGNK